MKMRKLVLTCLLFWLSGMALWAQDSGNEFVEVNRPWNGYWWPLQDGALATGYGYAGQPAPLAKYDAEFDMFQRSLLWELENRFLPDGLAWAGYCNGWAAASVLEPQPPLSRILGSTVFNYGDLTGLLTILHQEPAGAVYGTRYVGPSSDRSDVDPLEFQQVLELYLKTNNIPIIADMDCEEEVWSYPIYAYRKTWDTVGQERYVIMEVRCATDLIPYPDEPGFDDYKMVYTYTVQLDGDGNEVSAQWTNESVDNHPDFLWYPDATRSKNPYVKADNVDTILASQSVDVQDDGFEPNNGLAFAAEAPYMVQGTLLDDDWYQVGVEPFATGEVVLTINQQSPASDEWVPMVHEGPGAIGNPMEHIDGGEWRYSVDESAVFRRLYVDIPQQYGFTGNYSLWFDEITPDRYTPEFENDLADKTALMMMGSDDGETAAHVFYRDPAGQVTVYESIVLPPSASALFAYNGSNPFESTPEWVGLRVSAEQNVQAWWYSEAEEYGRMGLYRLEGEERQLVIPHIPSRTWYWDLTVAILNLDPASDVTLLINGFDVNGDQIVERHRVIEKGDRFLGSIETLIPEARAGSVVSARIDTTGPVCGIQILGTKNGEQETVLPLDHDSVSALSVLPTSAHIPTGGWTGIVLFNKGFEQTEVEFEWKNSVDWQTIATRSINLAPNQRFVAAVEDLPPEQSDVSSANRIEISMGSDQIVGYGLVGSHGNGTLSWWPLQAYLTPNTWTSSVWGGNLLNQNVTSKLHLMNPELTNRTVRIQSRNKDGVIIGDASYELPAGEVRVLGSGDLPLTEAEGQSQESIAAIRYVSNGRVIGWQTFVSNSSTGWEILR